LQGDSFTYQALLLLFIHGRLKERRGYISRVYGACHPPTGTPQPEITS
jgi:hypothetical protein